MLQFFAFSPYIAILVAAVLQTIVVIVNAWFPGDYTPRRGTAAFFHGFSRTVLLQFGVIVLDTAIAWLAGQSSTADWAFQLPGIVICFLAGTAFVLAFFRRLTASELVLGVGAITLVEFLVRVVEPYMSKYKNNTITVFVILMTVALAGGVVSLVSFLVARHHKPGYRRRNHGNAGNGRKDGNAGKGDKDNSLGLEDPGAGVSTWSWPWLWDVTPLVSRFFSRKLDLLLWALLLAEAMLRFYGLSLSTWW